VRETLDFACFVITLQNKSIRIRVLRADKVANVAGDTSLKYEGHTCISANKCSYFLLRLIFRKLKHRAVLKADSTAIAQIFLKETEIGF
jgi:hypothetical protein